MRTLLLWVSIALLTACVGKPSRPSNFYVLSVTPATALPGVAPGKAPAVGLGPVTLPELLDRPQIVTRSTANRVELAEYHRWGGELEQELVRTLAQNLMQRLATDRISFYPWPAGPAPDYQVSVQVFRFDGAPGERAVLDGVWRLNDGRRGCEQQVRRFHIEQTSEGSEYAGLIAAMSRSLGLLSDEIAAAVVAYPGCGTSRRSEP